MWTKQNHTESQNGWDRKEGTSHDHVVQTHAQNKFSLRSLLRAVSSQVLNISRDGYSTTSLSKLFQNLIAFKVKSFFLTFQWILLYFSLCPLSLVFSLGTTEKTLTLSSLLAPMYTEKIPPQLSLVVQFLFLQAPNVFSAKLLSRRLT